MTTVGVRREQTRAREPDASGYVDRDGVRVFWERYGSGERAVLLMPTWEIAHSRMWKLQIPFLARNATVVTFDPRGNGRTDRPLETACYDRAELTGDALAVLDGAGVDRVAMVSWCGCGDDVALAVEHPERVEAMVLITADMLLTPDPIADCYERIPDYVPFVEWFFAELFPEPHSTKQIEDSVGWALETDAATILRGLDAAWANDQERITELLGRVRCPTLVVQGSEDRICGAARGRAVAAAIPGAVLSEYVGSGHGPQVRDPVRFNLELRRFLDAPDQRPARWTRASLRPRRALYISSPIGLGHARRDLAIADELRKLCPDLEIDWLAQHPVTEVLEAHGERIHPASAELANESAHIASESAEHELNAFQAIRRMDEILLANFMVFHDVVSGEPYDLWIGDEAWELDYYLHENPELKSAAYAWLTDFVGYLPMPDGGDHEAALTADYNAEMLEQVARYPRIRDRAIFIGEPEDIVPGTFGPGLPDIRDWTERHYGFSGYVLGSAQVDDRMRLRAELGFAPEEQVCVVTVGGSGVGEPLLRRAIESFPEAKRLVPGLRMVIVAGPRIDPARLPGAEGLELLPYVPDLYRHLTACDLAIVQGGLATAMELIANRRPFIYVPLKRHFEQNLHVRYRIERHRAGRALEFDDATPAALAAAIAAEIGRDVDYLPVPADGAARAAAMIAELL